MFSKLGCSNNPPPNVPEQQFSAFALVRRHGHTVTKLHERRLRGALRNSFDRPSLSNAA